MRPLHGLLALLIAVSASAAEPKFSTGGFLFNIQYGPGFWRLGREHIGAQVGPDNAAVYVGDAQNTHTIALEAGYNILGHATIGAQVVATGWNLTDPSRGGGGMATGDVFWHPLELIFMNKPERPLPIDASIGFGLGYGIMGQRRGSDGLVEQLELKVDYYFVRYFGLGFFARCVFLDWHDFYLDYDNRSAPGNTLKMPDGLGGVFWNIGFTLDLRIGD